MTDQDIFVPPVPVPPPSAPGSVYPIQNATLVQPPTGYDAPVSELQYHSGVLEDSQVSALQSQGFTKGMCEAIGKNIAAFPLRIWVVDNSGSMAATDGNRMVETADRKTIKSVQCTRWREIQETVEYHAQMAALLKAPTVFRLLNNPGVYNSKQEFGVGDRGLEHIATDLNTARNIIQNAAPTGVTPLTEHVHEIRQRVMTLTPELNARGAKVAVILATDGLPTDPYGRGGKVEKDNFVSALRGLEGLPVWVVIRLCTDNEDIVEFYNNIDSQLELSIEVLDNYTDEAKEMFAQNKWINYTLALHRMREMGFSNRVFDMIDERPLVLDEIREFCFLLFGRTAFDGVPEPAADINGFLQAVDKMVKKEQKQWHVIKNKMKSLIDVERLGKDHGASCSIM